MSDFNDLSRRRGKAAVAQVINEAFESFEPQHDETVEESDTFLNPPPELRKEAYHGILSEIAQISTRSSEASSVAVCANVIANFSAMIGRKSYQTIGDGVCHCRPFFLLVGRTAKARKGTSQFTPDRIFKRVEELLNNKDYPFRHHEGGLASGEGLGWCIRDQKRDEDDEVIDRGVMDKRLLLIESEFAGCMAVANREKNNLSAVIRNLWDGRTIESLTKNNPWTASRPHVILTGHITASELIAKMTAVDAQSGFLNRFVIIHIARPKLVALPKPTPAEEVERLAQRIKVAVEFSGAEEPLANNREEVRMSSDAEELWCTLYPELTQEYDGLVGALLVRIEIYCRMFAMIFALMDQTNTIETQHIKAALAWVDYWRDSVQYIFGTLAAKAEAEKMSQQGKNILEFLKDNPGSSKSDLVKKFKNSMNAQQLTEVLNHLLNAAPPLITQTSEPRSDGKTGKPVTRFWPV